MSQHIADIVAREDLRLVSEEEIRKLALELENEEDFDPYAYTPPGPVAQAFITSDALTAVLMGPLGGGKTTACVFKRIYAATLAPIARHPEDGKPTRMCRWIVLRDTFRSAEKTVLESWKQWFPKNYPGSSAFGGNDRPFVHTLRFLGPDGVRIEAITEFAGLGQDSVETLMKGREYSGAWLNEIDTHANGALDDMEQRVGRYPKRDIILTDAEIAKLSAELGQPIFQPKARRRFVIGDMNAPTIDNWTYEVLVTNRKPDRLLYQQPSGVSADAENRFNLEPDYYDRIIRNQEDHFVHRMVHNKFGYSRAGKPVHPSFDHPRHVAATVLPARPDLDLHIGVDISTGGLSPAAIFAQLTTRINFIDELAVDHGMGTVRFAELLKQMLAQDYPNIAPSRVRLWADPASQYGGDKEGGLLAALDQLRIILGVPVLIPGNGSNELGLRLGAVDAELRGYLEANTSLLISPKCKQYISGIAGRYRFKKLSDGASNDYSDVPEKKHPISDLQDAGQYAIIGMRGHRGSLLGAATGQQNAGEGRGGWSSQRNGSTGWGKAGGFDPHKVGSA